MQLTNELIEQCRQQFPALSRLVNDSPAIFLDGPAGTQVPQRVIDAMVRYLSDCNANHGGLFPTSMESDLMLAEAHQALADLLGVEDSAEVAFGANMTSLTFSLARSLARTWSPGDEIVVTRLDHDANVSPWVLAAEDAGVTVHFIDLRVDDYTLDLEALQDKLSEKTRLVAVGCASNASGGINPVQDICRWAHDAGSLVFLDAVHYAPHRLIDVPAWDCDFLACSTYKFFGPHVGVCWGRRALLEELTAYKVRPAENALPAKWMTGTQNHEGIAGALAAVNYLADLGCQLKGQDDLARREALQVAFTAIEDYETELTRQLLEGLNAIEQIKVWGISDLARLAERVPTVSITHDNLTAAQLAERLGQQGIFAWHGNYYALEFTESLGLEPAGMLRIGLVHYNTAEEVERLRQCLVDFSDTT
ncbi:MAG: cysteine desulfurase-like protein [Pirellulaceae bacterium]|jgi:cysteine desulfurase family protein (TIGR01976 family)|nr:cysteine desulfurase-like protein [Planctomycetaceae bacterium]HIN95347.1 cysteine desulfurase-like protein [Planctomycetota bacterium]